MKNLIQRIFSSIILLPILLYIIFEGSLILMIFTMILFCIAIYEWHMMTKKYSYKICGLLFLSISFYIFYKLSYETQDIIFVLFICISTDIGGYVFGKLLKGPKLTKISPNKTYAGVIGGYVLSLISAFIFSLYSGYWSMLTSQLLIITILVSTVSQIGDIIISFFKRQSKIKNTGKIIPGHGGLLDRIDGMIFAIPTFYFLKLTAFLN